MQVENLLIEDPNDDSIHHSGDKAFKIVMKKKESALELVETFAPDIAKYLDLTHFELDNTNYINADFEEYYSDIVYRTHLKKTAKGNPKKVAVALLFEHKKTIRSYFLLFLQLLEYLIFIWKEDIRHNRKPFYYHPDCGLSKQKDIENQIFTRLFQRDSTGIIAIYS